MKKFEYYVSYNYTPMDVEKTLRILNALKCEEHKLLYGVNYFKNNGSLNAYIPEIKVTYQTYACDSTAFGDNENIRRIPQVIGNVIKNDTVGEINISDYEQLCSYIASLDSQRAFKYKYLIAVLIKTFRQHTKIRNPKSELLTCDKIRFCGEKDISFSTQYQICTEYDEKNLFIWFEIDLEDAKLLLCDLFYEAIITDDLENFENHLYSLSMVEYNNFNFVIGGKTENIEKLIRGPLSEICYDENQFAKYTSERKKYM